MLGSLRMQAAGRPRQPVSPGGAAYACSMFTLHAAVPLHDLKPLHARNAKCAYMWHTTSILPPRLVSSARPPPLLAIRRRTTLNGFSCKGEVSKQLTCCRRPSCQGIKSVWVQAAGGPAAPCPAAAAAANSKWRVWPARAPPISIDLSHRPIACGGIQAAHACLKGLGEHGSRRRAPAGARVVRRAEVRR